MKTNTILSFLILFISFFPSYACTCAPYEHKGFCDFVDYAELVVDARIIERNTGSSSFTIKINEVFKGQTSKDEYEVSVLMCSVWLNEDLGDRFILALNPHWDPDRTGELMLPMCGVYHLQIKNNQIKGKITRNKNSISYSSFRNLIQTSSCPASGPTFRFIFDNQRLQIISPFESYSGEISVNIYNVSGQRVKHFQVIMENGTSGQQELHVGVSTGVYVMYVEIDGNMPQIKKVIISGN